MDLIPSPSPTPMCRGKAVKSMTRVISFPETNGEFTPENGSLEYAFPFGHLAYFLGAAAVSFRENPKKQKDERLDKLDNLHEKESLFANAHTCRCDPKHSRGNSWFLGSTRQGMMFPWHFLRQYQIYQWQNSPLPAKSGREWTQMVCMKRFCEAIQALSRINTLTFLPPFLCVCTYGSKIIQQPTHLFQIKLP